MDIGKISPNGKFIAAANALSSTLYIYDIQMNLLYSHDYHLRAINAIAWSPGSDYIATGGEDCAVVVWQLNNGLIPKRVLKGHIAPVISLCFHPRGTILASGSMDEYIFLWDVIQNVPYKRLYVHNEPIFNVEFSFDGDLLMTASYEGYIRIWNVKDGMVLRTLHNASKLCGISAACLSPNGQFVLVFYTPGFIQMVNIVGGQVVRKFGCPQREGVMEPRHMVFIKPNHFLIATDSGVIKYSLDVNAENQGELVCSGETRCIDYNSESGLCLRTGPMFEFVKTQLQA